MASANTSSIGTVKYPYPSDPNVNLGNYVTIKLSPNNYFVWKKMMLEFIECQGMGGYINGKITVPPKKITVPDDSSTGAGTKQIDNEDYRTWEKSDSLLRRWILFTLNEQDLKNVVRLKSAKDVWTLLERVYSQAIMKAHEEVLNIDLGKNLSKYLRMHKAALAGDWESAKEFLKEEPDAIRDTITGFSETALLVAVRSEKRNKFVKELVELMSPEEVARPDSAGATALHMAALVGNLDAAKLLVKKNQELPNNWDNSKSLPIHRAALYGQREMVHYLLGVTKEDAEPKPFEKEPGVRLMDYLISSGLFDVALFLLRRLPDLAGDETSPLESIAKMPSAFLSGTRLSMWERLIYSWVPTHSESCGKAKDRADIENSVEKIVCVNILQSMLWKLTKLLVPQSKQIQEKKLKHHQAHELVECLCKQVVKLDYKQAKSLLEPALKHSINVGIPEVIEEILVSFPSAVYYKNESEQTIFHVAVVKRREKVFNLIYQFECKDIFLSAPDASMNSGLHLAGILEDHQQLDLRAQAAGAALQVQRELQWFKAVEKFSRPQMKDQPNTAMKTPGLTFTETHKELVSEGEQWMKDTANSCTIVAALIATVVFAAAITVPGGNNQNSGFPIFTKKKAFVIFGISDALALFTSTSSILMFLSILTARYGEEDFLYALPLRLIIGLVSLFLSIISMMVAFTATIILVFGYDRKEVLIPVIALACLPVTLFMFLQFPLLWDMIKSTYKPGIFRKKSDRILF